MPNKIFGWVVVAFLVFYVTHHPNEAALTTRSIGSGVAGGVKGLGDFLVALSAKRPS